MPDESQTDSRTFEHLEEIRKLVTERNELAIAKTLGYTVHFSYHNPAKGNDCFMTFYASPEKQPILKEMFVAELNAALKRIDSRLAELNIFV
jgi:hypothetical protein